MPDQQITPIRYMGAFGLPQYAKGLGRIDIFDQPGLELPVVGQLPQWTNAVMRADQLIAAMIADSMTDPNSEWSKLAREKGYIESWQQRTDVPGGEIGKLGAELVAGLVPDLLTGAIGKVGKAASLAPKAGGLAGRFDDLGPALGSMRVMEPVVKKVGDAVSAGAKKVPGIGWLLETSDVGKAHQRIQSAASAVAFSKAGGVTPQQMKATLNAFGAGAISAQEAARALNIADSQLQHIIRVKNQLGAARFDKWADDLAGAPEEFYTRILRNYAAESLDAVPSKVPAALQPLARRYGQVNSLMKEGMLSAPTVMPNALDIVTKSVLQGSNPAKVVKNLKRTWADPTNAIDEVAAFQGKAGVPAELGVEEMLHGLIGANRKESVLAKADPKVLAGIGAITGALAGGPVGAVLNAASLVGTKYGFLANTKGMGALESAARQVHFADGVVKYFTQKNPAFFVPKIRDGILSQVDALAGPKMADLADAIRARKFLVTPEEVGNIASSVGVDPANIDKIVDLWRNLHEEARQAGIAASNLPNFNYTVDSNLVRLARSVLPFPVWPLHNVPYYLGKMAEVPEIPQAIGSAMEKSQGYQDYYGLPTRFNDRLPLDQRGPGVWVDPMAPFSIAGQFSEPMSRDEEQVTDVDKVLDAMSSVGLGVNPLIQTLLQAAGVANKGRDFTDFLPWNRLARPVAAMAGVEYEPEGLLKGGLEGIRQMTAPGGGVDSTYPEYLIRKRIAEMSLENTGRGWWQNPEYAMALVDPDSKIRKMALADVGREQAALFLGRRVAPFNLSNLPATELAVRNAKARMGQLPATLTGTQYTQIKDRNPLAFGLSGISGEDKALELSIKQNFYYDLPTSAARQIFLKENPDFAAYQAWANQVKAKGGKPSVQLYLDSFRR